MRPSVKKGHFCFLVMCAFSRSFEFSCFFLAGHSLLSYVLLLFSGLACLLSAPYERERDYYSCFRPNIYISLRPNVAQKLSNGPSLFFAIIITKLYGTKGFLFGTVICLSS